MPTSVKKMNVALYNASVHLIEASKYLSNVPEFDDQAAVLMFMAEGLVSVIQPEAPKMTRDNMDAILLEIAALAGDES